MNTAQEVKMANYFYYSYYKHFNYHCHAARFLYLVLVSLASAMAEARFGVITIGQTTPPNFARPSAQGTYAT